MTFGNPLAAPTAAAGQWASDLLGTVGGTGTTGALDATGFTAIELRASSISSGAANCAVLVTWLDGPQNSCTLYEFRFTANAQTFRWRIPALGRSFKVDVGAPTPAGVGVNVIGTNVPAFGSHFSTNPTGTDASGIVLNFSGVVGAANRELTPYYGPAVLEIGSSVAAGWNIESESPIGSGTWLAFAGFGTGGGTRDHVDLWIPSRRVRLNLLTAGATYFAAVVGSPLGQRIG